MDTPELFVNFARVGAMSAAIAATVVSIKSGGGPLSRADREAVRLSLTQGALLIGIGLSVASAEVLDLSWLSPSKGGSALGPLAVLAFFVLGLHWISMVYRAWVARGHMRRPRAFALEFGAGGAVVLAVMAWCSTTGISDPTGSRSAVGMAVGAAWLVYGTWRQLLMVTLRPSKSEAALHPADARSGSATGPDGAASGQTTT